MTGRTLVFGDLAGIRVRALEFKNRLDGGITKDWAVLVKRSRKPNIKASGGETLTYTCSKKAVYNCSSDLDWTFTLAPHVLESQYRRVKLTQSLPLRDFESPNSFGMLVIWPQRSGFVVLGHGVEGQPSNSQARIAASPLNRSAMMTGWSCQRLDALDSVQRHYFSASILEVERTVNGMREPGSAKSGLNKKGPDCVFKRDPGKTLCGVDDDGRMG